MSNEVFKYFYHHSPSPVVKNSWIYVLAVGHFKHEADNPPFYRDYAPGYQMIYTVSGSGWVESASKYQILLPGTVVCVSPEGRHGLGALENNVWEHYWLLCNGVPFKELFKLAFDSGAVLPVQNN